MTKLKKKKIEVMHRIIEINENYKYTYVGCYNLIFKI